MCDDCPEDVNTNGVVDISDFLSVVSNLCAGASETVISYFEVMERPDCADQDRFIAVDGVSPMWIGLSTQGAGMNREGVPVRADIRQIGTDGNWRVGALIDGRLFVKQILDVQLRLGCECWCRDD
jgi:hypothetical protein